MHASYTGWLLVLYPATSFEQGLVWQSAFAVALWLVVAMIMLGSDQDTCKKQELRGDGTRLEARDLSGSAR
jgi:hypothetical protein